MLVSIAGFEFAGALKNIATNIAAQRAISLPRWLTHTTITASIAASCDGSGHASS